MSKLRKFRCIVSGDVLILLSYLGDLEQGIHGVLRKKGSINKGTPHSEGLLDKAVVIYYRALFLIVCISGMLGSLQSPIECTCAYG